MKEINGLTNEEVIKLKEKGFINVDEEIKTKSIGQIIFTNFLTLFNFLNFFLALAIFLIKSYNKYRQRQSPGICFLQVSGGVRTLDFFCADPLCEKVKVSAVLSHRGDFMFYFVRINTYRPCRPCRRQELREPRARAY